MFKEDFETMNETNLRSLLLKFWFANPELSLILYKMINRPLNPVEMPYHGAAVVNALICPPIWNVFAAVRILRVASRLDL